MIPRLSTITALPLSAALLLLAGCATVPEPLQGEFGAISARDADDRHVGSEVRWGGTIIDTRPGSEQTCIEVLARPLDTRARPAAGDAELGRFLACRDHFTDPAVFDSGRDLTVTGRLAGFVEGRIGDFRYVYPRVDAHTLFLWGDRPTDAHPYYGLWWYHDPWWPYTRFPWGHPRTRFSGHVIIVP